jgi:hypothetical protein
MSALGGKVGLVDSSENIRFSLSCLSRQAILTLKAVPYVENERE